MSGTASGVFTFPQSKNKAKFLRFVASTQGRTKSRSSISSQKASVEPEDVPEYMKDSDLIYKRLEGDWGLEVPNILLSVTGGTINCKLDRDRKRIELFRRGLMQVVEGSKDKTENKTKDETINCKLDRDRKRIELFRRGLMQVVEGSKDKTENETKDETNTRTGAWILTGGTDKGVAKEVGEALYDYSSSSVHLIGVTTWGSISGKDSLLTKEQQQKQKNQQQQQKQGQQHGEDDGNKNYKPNPSEKDAAVLDDRHTHFLLIDSGNEHIFHEERQSRVMFEKYMREEKKVLTVLVVLDGGEGTLLTVLAALENGIPVVVVKGSGRAADKLADLIKTDEEAHQDVVLSKCASHHDLIEIHDIDSKLKSSDIGLSILRALEKGNTKIKTQRGDEDPVVKRLEENLLTLILRWPKAEEVLREMFEKRNKEKPDFDINNYQETVKEALIENRPNIVEVFIEFGFNFKDFLTEETLSSLYDGYIELVKDRDEENILGKRLQQVTSQENKTTHCIATIFMIDEVIKSLIGSEFKFTYKQEKGKFNRWMEDGTKLKLPAHDLFIWAILCNYQSMAKMLWEKSKMISASNKDCVALALVGHSMLREMARKTDDIVFKRQLREQAKEFSLLASGVMGVCYDKDKEKARDLLVRVIPHLGETTCIEIAISTGNRYFISTHACTSLLMLVWHGHLSFETDNNWSKGARLIFCAIFPPAVPCIMNFKTEKQKKQKDIFFQWKGTTEQPGGSRIWKRTVKGYVNPNELATCMKFKYFFQAPITVYSYHTLSYLFFLSLFSYILIVQMKFYEATREDYLLFAWVISFIVEEIRQIYLSYKDGRQYLDAWNVIDWIGIAVFTIGMSLRQVNNETVYGIARAFLCVDVIVFYARLLQMFLAVRELGPKLLMIGRMFKDLAYFIVILMVFVVSYAVASHSLLYPNSELSVDTVLNVFRRPYWNMYGELFLDTVEGTEECTDDDTESTRDRCPTEEGTWAVPILMGFYMMAVNILLLNLLIAMFSYTFQVVQDNTDAHWHYLRYSMIYEYYDKAWLFPPLTLITRMIMFLLDKLDDKLIEDDLKKKFEDHKNDELSRWENVQMMTFLHQKNEKSDDDVKTSLDILIETVQQNLEEDRRAGTGTTTQPPNIRPNLKSAGPSRQVASKGSSDSDNKVAELQNKVAGVESEVTKVHNKVAGVESEVTKVHSKVESMTTSLDMLQLALQSKLDLLDSVTQKLNQKVDELGQQQQLGAPTDSTSPTRIATPPAPAVYSVPSESDNK